MWVFGAEKFLIFWRPPKTFLFVNYDLQNADLLWSYADRNSCRIRICFMGMWLPGTSWSKVTWLSNSADWAWLMKSTPKEPSPLRAPAPFLSSGLLQNVFSWNLQASEEMCMFLLFHFFSLRSGASPRMWLLMQSFMSANQISTWNQTLSSKNVCHLLSIYLKMLFQVVLVNYFSRF